jgi:hypothetical protein
VKASPLLVMRLTWLQVLLLPLPAYALELWVARQYLQPDPLVSWRTVEHFDVGVEHWLVTAVAIGAAWILPLLYHRRAMRRLRGRARLEVDPVRGTYRTPPPRVWRWPSETAAIEMAQARYAVRSAATLATLAGVELAVFSWLSPVRSFHCFGPDPFVHVPDENAHLLLVVLLAGVTVLLTPRRSAALRPIRDLLGTGAEQGAPPERFKPGRHRDPDHYD